MRFDSQVDFEAVEFHHIFFDMGEDLPFGHVLEVGLIDLEVDTNRVEDVTFPRC